MLKILIGILLLISLQYSLWYGKGGYQEYAALQQTVELQRQTNSKLKARNDKIETEITELKQGFLTIERYAREELGMIKQGEVFYQIVE
ncbi:cell division protein FtsB [Candidatus Halobeggiatoa sp. HSG11]|nr:cell division protein FtsB [Candidatus Halobeggiatoa sp. HSG11]